MASAPSEKRKIITGLEVKSVLTAHQFLPPPFPAVSTLLTLLPPPVLKCRQFTVAGKHLTVLKGKQIGGSSLWVTARALTRWQLLCAGWWG